MVLDEKHNEGGHVMKEHKMLKSEWESELESEVTTKGNVQSGDHRKHTMGKQEQ